jgi:hypothetical protein
MVKQSNRCSEEFDFIFVKISLVTIGELMRTGSSHIARAGVSLKRKISKMGSA